jgi:hypothetical protein
VGVLDEVTLFLGLLANPFFPGAASHRAPWASPPGRVRWWVAILTAAVGPIETSVPSWLFRVPELLAGSFALAVLSVTSVFPAR